MTTTSTTFLDRPAARISALALSVLIIALMFAGWGDDFKGAFSSKQTAQITVQNQLAATSNAALFACLSKRLSDVNRMKTEGIINDRQYAQFRERATSLCHAQNPS